MSSEKKDGGARTPTPWTLCHHLKSAEKDASCPCGYRGVVYGPEQDVPMAVFQPGHDREPEGQEGLGPQRYPREVEIANAQFIVRACNAHDELVAALEWYAEQVAGCRKLGSIGEPSRHALDADGGKRALAALSSSRKQGG